MANRIEFHQHGGPEVLRWAPYDVEQPRETEIIVRHHAIGLNYIDTYVRSGLYPVNQFPSGLGTEAAGEVVAVGSQVTRFQVGDRIVYCQSGLGAYSDYHHVDQSKAVILPDSISYQSAAASFLKGLTVYYLFHMTHKVQSGETVLLHAAAGGVGLIACQWAKALGANLIGCVSSENKAQRAQEAGAWATINTSQDDIVERVHELTSGQKVPVVYDSVGKATWQTSLDCLQPRGLLVSFGNASGPVTGVDLAILNQKGSLFVTRPSLNGYLTTPELLDQAGATLFSLISDGKIDVSVPESQQFPLRDAAKAHRSLESRTTSGACLLIP